jgi:hypothetical protein
MERKAFVTIGWCLMAVILISLTAVAVIATLQGQGAVPFMPTPSGRGGVLFPVAILPLGFGAVVVGILWFRRRVLRRRRGGSDKTPNPGVQRTGRTAARR